MKRRTFLKLFGIPLITVATPSGALPLIEKHKPLKSAKTGELRIISTTSDFFGFGYDLEIDGVEVSEENRTHALLVHPETFEPIMSERITVTEDSLVVIKKNCGLLVAFIPEWDDEENNFKPVKITYESDGVLYWNTESEMFEGDASHATLSVFCDDILICDTGWERNI